MSHTALRDFQYRDLERGVDVKVRRGEAVDERVLNMHKDGGAVLIRTKFVTGNEVAADGALAPRAKRSKKSK